MRPWLEPELESQERVDRLLDAAHKIRWGVRGWPRWIPRVLCERYSMAIAPLRRIYLADGFATGIGGRAPEHRAVEVLAHEVEHAIRAEAHGRWRWTLRYVCGLAGLYLLIGGLGLWLSATAIMVAVEVLSGIGPGWLRQLALPLVVLAGIVLPATWRWSAEFRRAEEIEGEAAGLAVQTRMARLPALYDDVADAWASDQSLHSYAFPYLVGGDYRGVHREIVRRARSILEES